MPRLSGRALLGRVGLAAILLAACRPAAPPAGTGAGRADAPAVGNPRVDATARPADPRPPEGIVLPTEQAHRYVGQVITVEGEIVQANRSPRGRVFLDFGLDRDAPDAFGLMIAPEHLANFPFDPDVFYLRRRVRVRGEVVTFEGRAEMRPRSPSEIQVIE